MDDAPWADIRGKALDARSLSRRLSKYGVKPRVVRVGDKTPKGYSRADLADPWSRYLPNVADVASIDKEGQKRFPSGLVGNGSAGPLGPLRDVQHPQHPQHPEHLSFNGEAF